MKLLLALTSALALASAAPLPAQPLIQAESALAARQASGGDLVIDRKLSAWDGASLGNDWGGKIGDWASFSVESSGGPQVLHLRYARAPRSGEPDARLRISVGGRSSVVDLRGTGEWDVWRWIAIPLGWLAPGKHALRLESLATAALNLDALVVSPMGQTPPQVARQLLFESPQEPTVRVQLSPGVGAIGEADGAKMLETARSTFDFLAEYLGERPSRVVTANVIGADQAGRDFVGHASGHEMYLEAALIGDTSHNWVHEMTHCFQRESGPWPTWLSEGEAWLAYWEAESALWKRDPARIQMTPAFFRARLPKYRAALVVDGHNVLQRWGSDGFPGDKVGAAYGMSNFILGDLRESFGPDLMKKYRALLREDRARGVRDEEGTIEERDALVVERLGRAAGEDLRARFAEWGFVLAARDEK